MKTISKQELEKTLEKHYLWLKNNNAGEKADLKELRLENIDLRGYCLSNIDFSWSDLINLNLEKADLENSIFNNSYLSDCSLKNSILKNADLSGASFRFCDLSNSDIRGANLENSNLEYATLNGVISDESTRFFKLYCPETGAFIGYKKCFNFRMVQLLIPSDAKRVSATSNACRCDKAKVLSITSIDGKESFKSARAYADENFIYRVGETIVAEDFNENRWKESTTGIHFFLTREEAIGYL
ncbi:TPA: pentapeptide repeat-containing protein [Clostridioides difficile]|uniref:pentapeptide repeat-containing protein n=1 Tax=Clostridioides difficile TaxID=1496 RepID=UPI0009753E1A|nr:pentapeptide repeat-containing protein [Clostridioides difficile]AXU73015.1 pentapeptide repeat family protein [Clostridioides difficile]EGT3782717.1 pentapeptide repeat-containing protein [Clostridioides difficile]EGT4966336.1 pentapeptide repeat-containing protein [Clostridioides difficile]EGT5071911.1 pentapeptide repeat-containing protein [Clostridioides difficile]ELX4515505.1 pentapeptide repeat-containing protein [Clostridioides difficile]